MRPSLRIIIPLIVVAVLVSLGAWLFLRYQATDTEENEQTTISSQTDIVDQIDIESLPTERYSPTEDESDRDNDGIPAEEEEKLGTSDLRSDTDSDGLTDKVEIEKWHTDPTKKDTDGDGYADLFEIMNGYNPSGEGALQQ
ncbi:hypothetical protein HN682_03660 [Candidatus Peregrinibacteria bacterium]|jgi:cytoskeletal protein RodZ|nr:hypothetical protein [Candidatus Peregrinibacteria bacterium]